MSSPNPIQFGVIADCQYDGLNGEPNSTGTPYTRIVTPNEDFYLPGGGTFMGIDSGSLGAGVWYQSDYASGRHFGGANVAFADGHVKWLKSQTVWREAKMINTTTSPHASRVGSIVRQQLIRS